MFGKRTSGTPRATEFMTAREILGDDGERRTKHAIEVRSGCVLGVILLLGFQRQ
jgi:hypothetical protein